MRDRKRHLLSTVACPKVLDDAPPVLSADDAGVLSADAHPVNPHLGVLAAPKVNWVIVERKDFTRIGARQNSEQGVVLSNRADRFPGNCEIVRGARGSIIVVVGDRAGGLDSGARIGIPFVRHHLPFGSTTRWSSRS
jgi:hypothetical protein